MTTDSILIPKLTSVFHIAENISAKIVGYINFRDLEIEGYDDVRYVLHGRFQEGHDCPGARHLIEWAEDHPRTDRGFWYASAEDITLLEERPLSTPIDRGHRGPEVDFSSLSTEVAENSILVARDNSLLWTSTPEESSPWDSLRNGSALVAERPVRVERPARWFTSSYPPVEGADAMTPVEPPNWRESLLPASVTNSPEWSREDTQDFEWRSDPGEQGERPELNTEGLVPLRSRVTILNDTPEPWECEIVGYNFFHSGRFGSYIVMNSSWRTAPQRQGLFRHRGTSPFYLQIWAEGSEPDGVAQVYSNVTESALRLIALPLQERTRDTLIPFGTRVTGTVIDSLMHLHEGVVVGYNFFRGGAFAGYVVHNPAWLGAPRRERPPCNLGLRPDFTQEWAEGAEPDGNTRQYVCVSALDIRPMEAHEEIFTEPDFRRNGLHSFGTDVHVLREGRYYPGEVVGYVFDADTREFKHYVLHNAMWSRMRSSSTFIGHNGIDNNNIQLWGMDAEPTDDSNTEHWYGHAQDISVRRR